MRFGHGDGSGVANECTGLREIFARMQLVLAKNVLRLPHKFRDSNQILWAANELRRAWGKSYRG